MAEQFCEAQFNLRQAQIIRAAAAVTVCMYIAPAGLSEPLGRTPWAQKRCAGLGECVYLEAIDSYLVAGPGGH